MLADDADSATMCLHAKRSHPQLGRRPMDLKRMGILMLVLAAACAIVAYESYRFNTVAVERMLEKASTQDMFTKLEAGIPMRSQISGFFAVVFGVAGLKLVLTKPNP